MTEQSGQGRHFWQNIRKYNSAFTQASLEAISTCGSRKGEWRVALTSFVCPEMCITAWLP